MLITEGQATPLAWGVGGTVIAAGVLLGFWLRRTERPGAGVAFGLLAFVGYALGIANFTNGTRVLLLQGDNDRYVRSDLRLYGSAAYTFADGRAETLSWLRAPHIVLNDTPRPLKLRTVRYGAGLSSEEPVGPFQRVDVDGIIRHFGPADPPPSESAGYERHWLTW